MTDLAQTPIIEWEEFSQLAVIPAEAKIASVVKSPDGRSLSILFEGFEARCDGSGKKSAAAVLMGSIEAHLPAKTDWTATRADFRGQVALKDGARATVELGLARAVQGETMVAPLPSDSNSVEFVRTLYSAAEYIPAKADGDVPAYAPLTLSVQLTLSCAGNSSALAAVDSVDLELWVR